MRILSLSLAMGVVVGVARVGSAALVFADDFSEPNGTLINGKSADTGGPWTVSTGATLAITDGTVNTSGGARLAFSPFSRAVAAGETLTLTFNSGPQNLFTAGFAGVSLYSGFATAVSPGNERIFVGDLSGTSTAFAATGNSQTIQSTVTNPTSLVRLTYAYDTGLAQLFVGGTSYGTANFGAGLALNALRIANNDGGDIQVDNLTVDVPEPAAMGLTGLAALGLLSRRRRNPATA